MAIHQTDENETLTRVETIADASDSPTAAVSWALGPLVVSGRVRKCEIGGFTVIARTGQNGDESLPVAYVAHSLDAVDLVRVVNSHQALIEALRGLHRGDCFCERGIGNPMVRAHSPACIAAQAALEQAEREAQ